MKSPLEFSFANSLKPALESGKKNGVDIKNVLEYFLKDMKDNNKEEIIDNTPYLNKRVIFSTAQDYSLKSGIIKYISSKGFILVKIDGYNSNHWHDPKNFNVKEVIEDNDIFSEK